MHHTNLTAETRALPRIALLAAFRALPQREQVLFLNDATDALSGLVDPSAYMMDLALNAAQDERWPDDGDNVMLAERYLGERSAFGMVSL